MTPPDRQPVLTGEHVLLRPMTAADREPLYAVASDRDLWAMHPAHDRWRREVFDAFFNAGLASGGALVIIDRASGPVIGSSRYDGWDGEADEIEIGWTYLARSHWGGPYNGEAKALMLGHIFAQVGTVVFMIGEDNLRSRRAVEKLGATLRPGYDERVMAGVVRRHVTYALTSHRSP
ncbi:GNAT family N-acetyltransferase [Sphingomonas sp. RS2018]